MRQVPACSSRRSISDPFDFLQEQRISDLGHRTGRFGDLCNLHPMDHVTTDAMSLVSDTRLGGQGLLEAPECSNCSRELPAARGFGDYIQG